jgi:hypothetical protein
MKIYVPPARLKETQRMARQLLRLVSATDNNKQPMLKTRVLACFVGRVVATFRGMAALEEYDDTFFTYNMPWLGQAVRKTGWNGMALNSAVPKSCRSLRMSRIGAKFYDWEEATGVTTKLSTPPWYVQYGS